MPRQADLTGLLPVAGVRLGSVAAGIKRTGLHDLVLIGLADGSVTAGVFTRNAFSAAPVQVAKQHMASTPVAWFLINSGNANAGTGREGIEAAQRCCAALAALAGCDGAAVLPFSTGVIGEPLPVERIESALPGLLSALDPYGWPAAARGIMTTDTVAKGTSRRVRIDGDDITVTGIAKGAGMIRPDMATMLAFLATDAEVEWPVLQALLEAAVNRSFNRITVDGDTSTNDACMLVATGRRGRGRVAPGSAAWQALADAVTEVCMELAQAIVRDGEGATKFVTVSVEQGASSAECLQVAYTIAHSPLVKTALFASDPNWGRILAAVGRAGLSGLDLEAVRIYLGPVCIVRNGGRAQDYTEQAGQAAMAGSEVNIRVLLARGDSAEQVWTCDLSYDYVKINAEYRT